jgi:putative iron-regulated protein
MRRSLLLIIALLTASLAVACGGTNAPLATLEPPVATTSANAPETSSADTPEIAALKSEVVANYADVVYAGYQDTYDTAVALQAALHAFVDNPSPETHQAAKDAWLAAREPYGQTEAFRFYGGPIDDENGPEPLLNGWPLDEAYVDYVVDAPDAGIINNVADYPDITPALLESLNESGAEENISVGYHAIEFLLWGQDLSADGRGGRDYTDYTTAANADRRGQYLLSAVDLLVGHLGDVLAAWVPDNADNYRAAFLAQDVNTSLRNMLTGLGVLSKSELSGERMFVAYDNQNQEDEHSCFSDNTHRDIINNARGIYNVWTGTYTRTDGTVVSGRSPADLLAAVDPALATRLQTLAEAALAGTQSIHVPFDQAIINTEYRPAVLAAVNALQDQGDALAQAANTLGLQINTDLPQ